MATQATEAGVRIVSLDSIRGIAALVVVFHHFQVEFAMNPYFDCGYLAVDIFFLLSGLVLAMRYEQAIATRRVSILQFVLARLGRLYPLQVIVTIFMAFPQSGMPFWDAVANLLMLQGTGVISPNYVMPSWSISTELAVNIVYAALLRARLASNVVLAAIVLWLTYVLTNVFGCGLAIAINKFGWGPMAAGMPRCFIGFFLGVGFYRCVVMHRHHQIRVLWANLSFIVATIGTGYLVATKQPQLSMTTDDYLLLYVLFPCLIYAALCPRGIACRLLCNAPMIWLGKISYSVYLLQVPVLYSYDTWLRAYTSRVATAPPWHAAAYVGLLLFVGALSYRYVEQPGRALTNVWRRTPVHRVRQANGKQTVSATAAS